MMQLVPECSEIPKICYTFKFEFVFSHMIHLENCCSQTACSLKISHKESRFSLRSRMLNTVKIRAEEMSQPIDAGYQKM